MMKRTICFIDDDRNELLRFKKAMMSHHEVITGLNYKECRGQLKKYNLKKPDLWVLDLYFPKSGVTNTAEQRSEMNQRYHQLTESIRNFRSYLEEIGQGSSGGLELLEKCKKDRTPVLFLTRKGTLDDAIQCIDKGAERVLRKPMPSSWPEEENMITGALDKAMIDGAPNLMDYFEDVISKNSHWNKYKHIYVLFIGALIGVFVSYLFSLLTKLFT